MPKIKHITRTKPLYFIIECFDASLRLIRALTIIGIWNARPNPNDIERTKLMKLEISVLTLTIFGPTVWKKFKPIRRGTAHIIKKYNPIVIPIVIDGFRRSFDKKGIRIKKRNILQSMEIKKPLDIDYKNDSIESIVEKIEHAIEQHPSFLKVIPEKDLLDLEKDNKEREW